MSAQLLRPGSIAPNPNTAVAKIAELVAERRTVARSDLLAAMATTAFPHTKAKPSDPGWRQGYVAGALRSGFLAIAEADAPVGEASPRQ